MGNEGGGSRNGLLQLQWKLKRSGRVGVGVLLSFLCVSWCVVFTQLEGGEFREVRLSRHVFSGPGVVKNNVTFVREFFVPVDERRCNELVRAVKISMMMNSGSRFVFLLQEECNRCIDLLGDIARKCGHVRIDVFVSRGPVLYSHKFELGRLFKGLFVISTADVAIGGLGNLSKACPSINAKKGRSVFVISRRDLVAPNKQFKNCTFYQKMGSCDVYVGSHLVITDAVLKNLYFAPAYWGVDNVIPFVLSKGGNRLYNLCPFVDVVHLHGHRKNPTVDLNRIRINHPDYSVIQIPSVGFQGCDVKLISQQLENKLFHQ